MILDFSSAGAISALKEFFVSLVKTALIAGIAFIGFRLNNIHLGLSTPNYAIYTGLIIVGRAVISSIAVWATTLPGDTTSTTTTTAGALA